MLRALYRMEWLDRPMLLLCSRISMRWEEDIIHHIGCGRIDGVVEGLFLRRSIVDWSLAHCTPLCVLCTLWCTVLVKRVHRFSQPRLASYSLLHWLSLRLGAIRHLFLTASQATLGYRRRDLSIILICVMLLDQCQLGLKAKNLLLKDYSLYILRTKLLIYHLVHKLDQTFFVFITFEVDSPNTLGEITACLCRLNFAEFRFTRDSLILDDTLTYRSE